MYLIMLTNFGWNGDGGRLLTRQMDVEERRRSKICS
jgi:hypothetical protein